MHLGYGIADQINVYDKSSFKINRLPEAKLPNETVRCMKTKDRAC